MTTTQVPDSQRFFNHVAGKQLPAGSGKTFTAFNPTTGKEWGVFADSDAVDVDRAVTAAVEALDGSWGKLSNTRRGRLLMAW